MFPEELNILFYLLIIMIIAFGVYSCVGILNSHFKREIDPHMVAAEASQLRRDYEERLRRKKESH